MSAPSHRVIAIDGPAASGKSSVARRLAHRLGFIYVNTGAMYRVATLLVLRRGVAAEGTEGAEAAVSELVADGGAITFGISDGASTLLLDGKDPGEALSSPEVNAAVSWVAAIPAVREALVAQQRKFGEGQNIVMEGRDIGSVVFPDTPYKFYVDASLEVRAQRRALQGFTDDLAKRDKIDSSRATSPLVIPQGAEVVDSSSLSLEEVVDEIYKRLQQQGF